MERSEKTLLSWRQTGLLTSRRGEKGVPGRGNGIGDGSEWDCGALLGPYNGQVLILSLLLTVMGRGLLAGCLLPRLPQWESPEQDAGGRGQGKVGQSNGTGWEQAVGTVAAKEEQEGLHPLLRAARSSTETNQNQNATGYQCNLSFR